MSMQRRFPQGFFPLPRPALAVLLISLAAFTMTGCSDSEGSPDSKVKELCNGAVSSEAETALEKMTGSADLSSSTGSTSNTPKDLRKKALEWGTEKDPEPSAMGWSCRVFPDGAPDGDIRVNASALWSVLQTSDIEELIHEGSNGYVEVSPDVFIAPLGKENKFDESIIYFPCQVAEDGNKSAVYTMSTKVNTPDFKTKGTQSDANKVALSTARWMSHQVDCVNNPEIPTSTR